MAERWTSTRGCVECVDIHTAVRRAKCAAAWPPRIPVVKTPEMVENARARAAARARARYERIEKKRRHALALEAGRIPGAAGRPKKYATENERWQAVLDDKKRYRLANLVKVRADAVKRSKARFARLKIEDPTTLKIIRAAHGAACRVRKGEGHSERGLTAVVRRIWDRQEGVCAICPSTDRLELDHILAVANGGGNEETNLQWLCETCNRSKSDKDFHLWLASQPVLEGVAA